MKRIAFDTETTGTSIKTDELLQITIVDENCNILLETYLKPPTKTNWAAAERVNHISYNMVKDAPTYAEMKDRIQAIFDNAEEIIGYNVGFDVHMVENNLKLEIDPKKVRDLLKEFRDESKKKGLFLPHHKLGDAVDFYCPQFKNDYLENAHDASCDTVATMRVANAMDNKEKRYIPEVKNIHALDEFLSKKIFKEKNIDKDIVDIELS